MPSNLPGISTSSASSSRRSRRPSAATPQNTSTNKSAPASVSAVTQPTALICVH